MNYRLPINGWVSYTADRLICTVDLQVQGTEDAITLGCHVPLNEGPAVSFDAEAKRVEIDTMVRGLVEAARVAYNASEYPEGSSDSTLVPVGCVLYLDNALSYLMCQRYNLKRWNGFDAQQWSTTSGTFLEVFKEAWLDCMVFLRAIRNQYCDTIPDANGEILSEMGEPWYALSEHSGRNL
jgi:hypothetical protein